MKRRPVPHERRGAILVLSALLMVVVFGMAAMAIDVGYMMLVRTQLQLAADAGAMAAGNSLHMSPDEIEAKATEYVTFHTAGGRLVTPKETLVELGTWDTNTNKFTPTSTISNAVRVTARRQDASFFFGPILGKKAFDMEASSIAMANPRDIAFVIDLSGSMNDDTEPAWATSSITSVFGPLGFPSAGNDLMTDLYADFGYGKFPGTLEWVGQPLGIKKDKYAFAELTKDASPLSLSSITSLLRILPTDTEAARKKKAYSWIIDNQIAKVMPAAKPTPDSSKNYAYWEKYLDYIMQPVSINITTSSGGSGSSGGGSSGSGSSGSGSGSSGSGSSGSGSSGSGSSGSGSGSTTPKPPTPPKPPIGSVLPGGEHTWSRLDLIARTWSSSQPATLGQATTRAAVLSAAAVPFQGLLFAAVGAPPNKRGTIPPSQDGDRIDKFNNPNNATFPKAKVSVPQAYRNQIGYLTYVQFMMDHGRDLKPDDKTLVPSAYGSSLCPLHDESTAGGTFKFPPREQPMHASRRSLIAAVAVVEDRNGAVPSFGNRDQVAVIAFDTLAGKGPQVTQSLTGDYGKAMEAVTKLQAVGDKGNSTATESGLLLARKHLKSTSSGGFGRDSAEKVVVLLTDGVPNAYSSTNATIDSFLAGNSSSDFYGGGYYWYDAPLIQAKLMKDDGIDLFPVGIGLGTDYNFMDRLARLGGTANAAGQSPRGSGNPTEYEQTLTEIFEKIIKSPTARLVQ